MTCEEGSYINELLSEFEDIAEIIFKITDNTSTLADESDLRNVLDAALLVQGSGCR